MFFYHEHKDFKINFDLFHHLKIPTLINFSQLLNNYRFYMLLIFINFIKTYFDLEIYQNGNLNFSKEIFEVWDQITMAF
jgi:hypothetical protein